MAHELYEVAGNVIASYKKAVPADEEFPIEATAELVAKTGSPARALEVYDRSFKPLWPDALMKRYFDLLKQSNSLRAYLEKARAGVAANPTDLASAARIFHYWKQQNNMRRGGSGAGGIPAAQGERSARRGPTDELVTLAQLYESSHNYDEAARNYYALYNAARNDDKIRGHCAGRPGASAAVRAGAGDSIGLRQSDALSRRRDHGSSSGILERRALAAAELEQSVGRSISRKSRTPARTSAARKRRNWSRCSNRDSRIRRSAPICASASSKATRSTEPATP